MPAGADAGVDEKKFRDKQRADKKVYNEAMDKQPQKSTSEVIKEKIVGPEKQEPASRVAKQFADKKKSGMRRRLLINTDEDSDEDGAITTNPVAKQDTEKNKYVPPSLNLALNEPSSVTSSRVEELARTPRSQLSASEKREVDQDAIMGAIQEKHDPDMLKKVTPKAGKPFKPPAPPKITQ